jgi:hypothetical protein
MWVHWQTLYSLTSIVEVLASWGELELRLTNGMAWRLWLVDARP